MPTRDELLDQLATLKHQEGGLKQAATALDSQIGEVDLERKKVGRELSALDMADFDERLARLDARVTD